MQNHKFPISVSLVIPTFNNGQTLVIQLSKCIKIIDSLCKTYEVIISNDASIDNTTEILNKQFGKQKNVITFNQKRNLGISKNIKFLYSKARYEYILLFSIDGTWNPKNIETLIESASKKNTDIVIGQRRKKAYSLSRYIISTLYNILSFIFFGVITYDAGSIKIFKKRLFKEFPLRSKSIFFEAEMIIRAQKKGLRVNKVPVDHKMLKNYKSSVNYQLIFSSLLDLIKLRLYGL